MLLRAATRLVTKTAQPQRFASAAAFHLESQDPDSVVRNCGAAASFAELLCGRGRLACGVLTVHGMATRACGLPVHRACWSTT